MRTKTKTKAKMQVIHWVACCLIFSSYLYVSSEVFGQSKKIKGATSLSDIPGGGGVGFTYYGSGKVLSKAIRSGLAEDYVKNAECIYLLNEKVTTTELDAIATLKSVYHLEIDQSPDPVTISTSAIESVAKIRSLEHLVMNVSAPENTQWSSLKKLQSLEGLEIYGSPILRQNDLDAIGSLSSLDFLRLYYVEFRCSNFKWLAQLSKLRSIDLGTRKKLDPKLLKALRKMEHLESLSLTGLTLNEQNMKDIVAGCGSTLKRLSVNLSDIAAFEQIKSFSKIEFIHIHVDSEDTCDLSGVSKLRNLKSLTIHGGRVSDVEFEKLRNHPSLDSIEFNNTDITLRSVDVFKSLQKLTFVRLSGSESVKKIEKKVRLELKKKQKTNKAK